MQFIGFVSIGDGYRIYIAVEGKGKISGENYEKEIAKGDYFFVPDAAMGKLKLGGNLEVVECY